MKVADTKGDLIAFGRWFIGNVSASSLIYLSFVGPNQAILTPQPDLPLRLMHNQPVVEADRSVYYTFEDPKGYIDFPTFERSTFVKQD